MKQKIFKTIANLQFAILVLLFIAFVSVLGTIIEQDQSIEVYKSNYPLTNQLFGFLSWNIILYFGLDHLYKTWWFLSLIFIFGLSLFTCTILQQIPAFKIARRSQFFRTLVQFQQLKMYKKVKHLKLSKLFFKIKNNQYSIFQQKNIIYCYQGLIGRVGPILVHVSMVLILVGTIFTALTGFNSQEIVPKTETFHIQNIFLNGKLTQFPSISLRINDFWILYKDQNIVNQFYSNLSILNLDGEEISNKTIFVNSPFQYHGVDFYQTSWNLIGLRFNVVNDFFIQYPLVNLNNSLNKVWLTWISNNNQINSGYIFLIENLQGYGSIYSNRGQFLGNIEINEIFSPILPYKLTDIINSDGLQMKVDPGIPIIYGGFFLLMLTTIISYISYSQIWILKSCSNLFIGGNTSRASFEFEFEFFKLVN